VSADGAPAPKGPPVDWLRLRRYIANHYELTEEQLNSVEQSLKHWVLFHFRAPKWPKRLPPWVFRLPVWEGGTIILSIDEAWARRARNLEGMAKLLALSQGKPVTGPPAADEAALRDLCGKWAQIRISRKVIDDKVRTVRSLAPQAPKPESAATEPQTTEPSFLNRSWPEGLPRAAPFRGLSKQQTAGADPWKPVDQQPAKTAKKKPATDKRASRDKGGREFHLLHDAAIEELGRWLKVPTVKHTKREAVKHLLTWLTPQDLPEGVELPEDRSVRDWVTDHWPSDLPDK
jgi:hypothetical protein